MRKSIRLQEYDYSQPGYYFVTMCTKDKQNLFGNVGTTALGRLYIELYNSELYSELEREETKLWTYSVPKLYDLYQESIKTGKLELADY